MQTSDCASRLDLSYRFVHDQQLQGYTHATPISGISPTSKTQAASKLADNKSLWPQGPQNPGPQNPAPANASGAMYARSKTHDHEESEATYEFREPEPEPVIRTISPDISSTHEATYAESTIPLECIFASACEAGVICVWDASTLNPVAELKAPGMSSPQSSNPNPQTLDSEL
jgi:hypothetical protein